MVGRERVYLSSFSLILYVFRNHFAASGRQSVIKDTFIIILCKTNMTRTKSDSLNDRIIIDA